MTASARLGKCAPRPHAAAWSHSYAGMTHACQRTRGWNVANRPPRKLLPYEKAQATSRWSEIIFRALSAKVADRWKFVSFRGAGYGEWRGVVDVLAIRKSTVKPHRASLKRGDLFDIILIQMKGGRARNPNPVEMHRMRLVARHYHARNVVLFQWRIGVSSRFFVLRPRNRRELTTGKEVFA